MNIDNHIVGKHAVFPLVERQVCTLADAARQLRLSYRQTRRWWRRYQLAAGSLVNFAVPKRGGGWNKATQTMVQSVLAVAQRHPTVSVSHLRDLVAEEAALILARSTVARILTTNGQHRPRVKTVRMHVRFESQASGQRLQMDTTSGAWLMGYRLIYLIAVLDELNEQFADWIDWYHTKHLNRTTGQIPQNRLTPSIWNKPVRVHTLRRALLLHYTRKVSLTL